jgi:hypothetical protein
MIFEKRLLNKSLKPKKLGIFWFFLGKKLSVIPFLKNKYQKVGIVITKKLVLSSRREREDPHFKFLW